MITLKNTLPHATATWTNWHFQTWVVMVLWDCDARWGAEHACLGTWGTDFSPGHSASFVKLSQTPPDVTIPSLHCIQFNIWGFFICLSLHWIQNALWSLRQLNTCLLKDPFGQSEVGDWKLGWARLYFSASANLYFSRLVSCTWILLEHAVQNNLTSTFFFFWKKDTFELTCNFRSLLRSHQCVFQAGRVPYDCLQYAFSSNWLPVIIGYHL